MTLVFVAAILVLWVLPSLLFLGLWHGLLRLQRRSLVARASKNAGCSDPVVTWGDVIDAYTDPQKRLLTPPSASQSSTAPGDQCPACARRKRLVRVVLWELLSETRVRKVRNRRCDSRSFAETCSVWDLNYVQTCSLRCARLV